MIISSIFAGVFISFGCCLYAASDNAMIGSLLFAVGLLTVKQQGFKLFTGAIGRFQNLTEFKNCLIILMGNVIGALIVKSFILFTNYDIYVTINNIGYNKTLKNYFTLFLTGILCGFIMYFATCKISEIQTILLVMLFIICGFEHSIADSFYFVLNGQNDIIPLLIIIIGNTFGANIPRIYKEVNQC